MPETAEKRPPGRPKGYPKTGGRKPGARNKVPDELRKFIDQRGRPLEFLAAIADGRKVSAADPENPGQKVRVYPTLAERTSAAQALLNKLLPDLKATELTGADGGPVRVSDSSDMDAVELARRVAFTLAQGLNDMPDAEPARAPQKPQALDRKRSLPSEPPAAPAPPEPVEVGGLVVTFAEALPGDRERWAIRDGEGRLVGSAMGKLAAIEKARDLNA